MGVFRKVGGRDGRAKEADPFDEVGEVVGNVRTGCSGVQHVSLRGRAVDHFCWGLPEMGWAKGGPRNGGANFASPGDMSARRLEKWTHGQASTSKSLRDIKTSPLKWSLSTPD
ncbi:hypothetical protein GCM10008949_41400 [Deinococcus humi]|nr:hypothetical protein GCM10008949_41400 [Deinococcus humi]